jgi:glycosyltransferase involved in cell wall biosynthesis
VREVSPRAPSSRPRRLWVLSELYYPEETSTGYLVTRIAEGLATTFDVRVLCSQPTYASRGLRAPRTDIRNGVPIRRCPSTTLARAVPVYRLLNVVTVTASLWAFAIASVRRGDCLLVVTNPPLLPFVAAIVTWLRGACLLLLVHDVYPNVLTASGLTSRTGFLARCLRRMSQWLYGSARRTIVLGRDMKRLIEAEMRISGDRIAVIPNWADADAIHPTKRTENALLAELGLIDKFVVQYAGNMGYTHGLECLVDAMEKLRGDGDVFFLFIGSGVKKAWLEAKVRELALPNARVLGNRPRGDQPNFLNACDVAIITFVAGMAGVSVPSRMYNILAAGKPIIAVADDDSELAAVVRDERVGWVVPPGDADGIVQAVLAARRQPEALLDMGRRARVVAERYSLTSALEAYRRLLAGLGSSGMMEG